MRGCHGGVHRVAVAGGVYVQRAELFNQQKEGVLQQKDWLVVTRTGLACDCCRCAKTMVNHGASEASWFEASSRRAYAR